jgi:hypothetical protein
VNKQKLSLAISAGALLALFAAFIVGNSSPYLAYSQTEEMTINMTTAPNGTHLHNGTAVPENVVSELCGMPIFKNTDMCT